MRMKSNRYKCRNLPVGYKVNARIKSKSISSMIVLGAIGTILITKNDEFRILGFIFLGCSIYFIFFMKNKTAIEFSDKFMVVYSDQKSDECLLVYYDEILSYHYYPKLLETDTLVLDLINHQQYELKSLDKRKMMKNVHKYIQVNQLEDDD